MRVQRLLALAASLLLPSASAQKDSPEILTEISNLQSALTRLNSLLQQADLKPDDEIMTHAAMIVQRVRNLVLTADENVDMIKHKRKAERVAARHAELRALRGSGGIGNGEAQFERDAPEAAVERESAEEQERHLDFQRSLAEITTTFPECKERLLDDCIAILDSQLAELNLDAEKVIHEKRNLNQDGYNKVVIITNLEGTGVLGKHGDGIVHYEFPWDDATEAGLEGRILNVDGQWDCHALMPDQCCALIKMSAPNQDTKGNMLECHIFVPFGGVGNPKKNDRVFINLSPDGRVQEAPFIA